MVREIEIRKLEDINQLLLESKRDAKTGRLRSPYFYRGVSNKDYSLKTSLQRQCKSKANHLEGPLLSNFSKYVSIEDPSITDSIWSAMIVGQHHGLPTRLLDWTHSTAVALHFATTVSNLEDLDTNDCAVWRIDADEIHKRLPETYRKKLKEKKAKIFSIEGLTEVSEDLEQYDRDMGNEAFVILEPPSIDQRIVNQYAFFSVIPSGINNLEEFLGKNTDHTVKYVIDKNLKWDLRDLLDQMNMNERMIYPGKDGIAQWLGRRYYVK